MRASLYGGGKKDSGAQEREKKIELLKGILEYS